MILGLLAQGQLGRITGSPETLLARIEQRARDVGARLHYARPVARIAVEGGRAVGVVLDGDVAVRARAVVSTVDSGQLFERFLGGTVREGVTFEQWSTWERVPPGAFVNFVTAGSWDATPWYTQARLAEPVVNGRATASRLTARFFPPETAGAGPGECAVETGIDVADFEWFARGDAATRRGRTHQLAVEVRARMERLFPGFSSRVLRHEVVPPDLLARAVRAPNGQVGAYLPTLAAMDTVSPRTVPQVAGVYLAGQWAIAGAGVLAVLYSGRNVAQLMCTEDGRGFRGDDARG
jgi:phytoene dehydrogenase-like protein